MANRLLSKSKYMNGLQCPKLLWLIYNDKEKVPGPNEATQAVFDQGHQVGELAKRLFPGGIDVPCEDFKDNLKQTPKYMAERKPVFESGFMVEGIFCRPDILKPVESGKWDMVEVKSSTKVKPENIQDVAFQRHVCRKAGLDINKCYLAHINNQYVRDGEYDPQQLFTIEDITDEVEEAARGIDERIERMFEIIASPKCPDMPVGCHCKEPYECAVQVCWDELPKHNIFNLYYGGKKCFEMFNQGIFFVKDIPANHKLNNKQKIQQWCEINGKPHIDGESIRHFMQDVQYPVHYLDFETINPGLPLYDGTKPYQRIPFQFSMHMDNGKGELEQHAFLAEGQADPRLEFLNRLKKSIEPSGSIMVYNQAFEESVLKELAEAFPEYNEWVDSVRVRLVDLLKPFQNFHYYHPDQSGSASIKHVMPAMTGEGYEGLGIAEGGAASRAFLDATFGNLPEDQCKQIRTDLEKYCGRDTEGMAWILEKLKKVSK